MAEVGHQYILLAQIWDVHFFFVDFDMASVLRHRAKVFEDKEEAENTAMAANGMAAWSFAGMKWIVEEQ